MFENFFSKNPNSQSSADERVETSAAVAQGENPADGISAEVISAWQERIHGAAGDASALLQLAREAPTVALKLAAIEALTQEQSLRQAMHDFRDHDKRLYRAAKSRWETASGSRLANEQANALIEAARALLELAVVPVNRVVELDRAWAALNGDLLDGELPPAFAALSEQLGAKVRAQGEHAQTLTRWLGAVDTAMEKLQAVLPGIAQGDIPPDGSDALALALLELAQGAPDAGDARCAEKTDAANRMLALASSMVERAKFLLALPVAGAGDEAHEKRIIERWREFPEITDGELHTVLAHRFADWRNASSSERQREHEALSAQEREQRAEKNQQRMQALQREIEAAEAAQAAGHVADLTRLLSAIDHMLKRGAVSATFTQRIDVLRREQRRLHDWQRWSGAQGREQLAAEAQALATAAAGKVAIKAHAEAIEKLRERWKELDKLGGASSQSVWHTFDEALKTAYVPVAAHLEKLKQAREENLAAREKIVAELTQAAATFFPPAQAGAEPGDSNAASPDWRAIAHVLDEAQVAWRKLGPVEHTVPRKAQKGDKAVTTRYAAALQVLHAPLKHAQADARQQREQLIAAAKEVAGTATTRDVVDKVRKLQAQWQTVAKGMPLPRRDENALWTAFRGAIDAIFAAKDAARAAVEAEFSEKLKAREDIVECVTALASATLAADIKRGLAEAESAWRAAPPLPHAVPKALAAKLDARYRAARDAANKRTSDLALHATQARYDALIAKMALCEEREALLNAPDSNGTLDETQAADLEARWNAIENLPAAWKPKLDARFGGVAVPVAQSGKKGGETLPDLLLNLEVACGIDSPEAFLAARQQLKILALKAAMEGRQTVVTTPADIERWLLDAAAYPLPDAVSRERLSKVVAAVRRRKLP